MQERTQLDIDRRLIAHLRSADGAARLAELTRGLIGTYTPTYIRNRIFWMEAQGIVTLVREHGANGRLGITVHLVEAVTA